MLTTIYETNQVYQYFLQVTWCSKDVLFETIILCFGSSTYILYGIEVYAKAAEYVTDKLY